MAKREAIYNTAVEEMTAFNARYEAGEKTYFQMKRPRLDKDSFSAPPWVVLDRALFERRKKVALQSLNPPLEEGAWVLEQRRNLPPCKHPLSVYKVFRTLSELTTLTRSEAGPGGLRSAAVVAKRTLTAVARPDEVMVACAKEHAWLAVKSPTMTSTLAANR